MNEITKFDAVEMKEWVELARKAGIVPKEMNEWQALAIVEVGRELGIQPMQSLRSISFISGKMTMSVVLQLAIARTKGVRIKNIEESQDCCKVTLARGDEEVARSFTFADAITADLTKYDKEGKIKKIYNREAARWEDRRDGSWEKYKRDMLCWRAMGRALNMIASDVTMGLGSPEEAEEIEEAQSIAPEAETPLERPKELLEGTKPETIPETRTEPKAQLIAPPENPPIEVPAANAIPDPTKISSKQVSDVWKLLKSNKVPDEAYRSILAEFGHKHTDEITTDEFPKVIKKILAEGSAKRSDNA